MPDITGDQRRTDAFLKGLRDTRTQAMKDAAETAVLMGAVYAYARFRQAKKRGR